MAISISVNGQEGREGFLIAPSGSKQFPSPLELNTTDGSKVDAKLAVKAPAGVTVKLSTDTVTIGPKPVALKITAQAASKKAGDITLQVKVGGRVKASCVLTAIKNPQIHFSGRFQARFATDGDFFNEPRGTAAGWTWALEGEPDFVPAANNIPINPGMAVGRVVRFQNAVSPRPHVAPIGVKVKAVSGQLGLRAVTYKAGDEVIGQKVNLGANTYLAANEPIPPGPQPFETYGPGFEPMENFELHIGRAFSGKPKTLNDRPKSNSLAPLTPQELTKYGVVPLNQFNTQRITLLLTDYHALSPANRTGTPAGRNLAKRIAHLGGSAPDSINPLQGTLPFGWAGKEFYVGLVNDAISIRAGNSAVLAYFKTFSTFKFQGTLLNFHSDELCGQFDGILEPFTAALARQQE